MHANQIVFNIWNAKRITGSDINEPGAWPSPHAGFVLSPPPEPEVADTATEREGTLTGTGEERGS